jgi:hypothetical protein
MHEKRARYNQEVRSHDAIDVQGNSSPNRGAGGKNYNGDGKCVWVKRVESKPVQNLDGSIAANALKVDERQGAEGTVQNTETNNVDGGQLQQTRSDAGDDLKLGETKMAHDGSCMHQRQESD